MAREMMGMTDQVLDVLNEVEIQIKHVENLAREIGCKPSEARWANGEFMIMAPLLAKSNCLNALVMLSAKKE